MPIARALGMSHDDPQGKRAEWPFEPLQHDGADQADLPGGTAAEAHKKDQERPTPPGKAVNPRPQNP